MRNIPMKMLELGEDVKLWSQVVGIADDDYPLSSGVAISCL